jgi:hypothetical protein
MTAILNERHLTDQELEKLGEDLEKPSTIDPELDFMISKKVSKVSHYDSDNGRSKYRVLTREEVRQLMEASEEPVKDEREPMYNYFNYPTYSRDFVEQLVKEHFDYEIEEAERKLKFENELKAKKSKNQY